MLQRGSWRKGMMAKKSLKLMIFPKFSLGRCEQWNLRWWVDESISISEDLTVPLFAIGSYNASVEFLHVVPDFREGSYRAWGVSLWSGWVFYYQRMWKGSNCSGENVQAIVFMRSRRGSQTSMHMWQKFSLWESPSTGHPVPCLCGCYPGTVPRG